MFKAVLLNRSAAWQNLLIQMGMCYQIMEDSSDLAIPTDSSLIVLNGIINPVTHESLKRLDRQKTAVITTPEAGKTCEKAELKSQVEMNGENYYFDLPLVFFSKSERIVNCSSFLPFSFDEAFNKFGTNRKQFYASGSEMPTELVRKVNLKDVFRFVRNFILDALDEVNLKAEVLSALPDNKPLFIFRIDTDFAIERDISNLYEVCGKYNISATWFIDVFSEKRVKFFAEMENQEVALHCDKHYVYKKQADNERNLVRANQTMLDAGLIPRGFAAPFGFWNQGLENVLVEHNYLYSSEFSFAYDCLPIVRWKNEKSILQIPSHPINPGRLRRAHFTDKEMLKYFTAYIDECKKRNVPAVIYHHPSLHLNEIIPHIFEYVNNNGFNNLSMENYAAWWIKRGENLCKKQENDLFTITKLKRELICYPPDYERVFKKSWRYWLHEAESWQAHKHYKKHGYPKYLKN